MNAANEDSISWREVAIKLFPERERIYSQAGETVWSVLFDLRDAVIAAHNNRDEEMLERIYRFAEWCHSQRDTDPELWTAAYSAFYEHLVENRVTYREIPKRLSPEVFADMLPEFKQRLDNRERYLIDDVGTFAELVRRFDKVHGTNFGSGEGSV